MGLSKFTDLTTLSNTEICEEIIKTEKHLFNLRFKKATQQAFKPHEIKLTKRTLVHLKSILTLRLYSLENK